MTGPRFKPGDVVLSQSGLSYRIFQVKALDECGSFAYRVRRLRGEQIWGPHRWLAECDVFPGQPVKVQS